MTVNRYHVDCYAFYDSARLDVTKCDDGDYVLFEDYVALQARVEKLESALLEAKLQIEYLHGKFLETGSGNAVLDTIRRVLGEK